MKIQSGEVFGYITDDNAIEPYVRPARIGDTWTTPEGVEVMVVPVVATLDMIDAAYRMDRYVALSHNPDFIWSAMLATVKEPAHDPR